MTGNKRILIDLQPFCHNTVNFKDNASGKVIGIGSLIFPGLSRLKDVMLSEGLTINLISLSQLCDENFVVRITKDKYMVFDQDQYQIIEGKRSSNNCSLLTSISICIQ